MSSMSDETRPAVIQLPASEPHGTRRNIDCQVEGMQGKRLILKTNEYVRESTLVSVEYEDTLFLGEVIICAGARDEWTIEMRVEQMLTGLQSLMALRAHLLSESVPAPLALMPVGMRN